MAIKTALIIEQGINLRYFAEQYIFSLSKLACKFAYFKVIYRLVSTVFLQWSMSKVEKTVEGSVNLLNYSRLPITRNLQGKSRSVRVNGSSKEIAGSEEKKTVFIAQ